jgi:hypothetical protein
MLQNGEIVNGAVNSRGCAMEEAQKPVPLALQRMLFVLERMESG